MLRIGLTGNLGSGKSTAAKLFAEHGAYTLSSDAIGRELMQPGHPLFQQIVDRFGRQVLAPDGTLARPALARVAFAEGRAEDLNAIVHPAVITRQAELAEEIFFRDPKAVLVIESALIFTTSYAGADWRGRFDRLLLITAPERDKVARFVERQKQDGSPSPEERRTLEIEAHRRLALQTPDEVAALRVDFVLTNDGTFSHLAEQVDSLWPSLRDAAAEASFG